jgi:hypothetical protein
MKVSENTSTMEILFCSYRKYCDERSICKSVRKISILSSETITTEAYNTDVGKKVSSLKIHWSARQCYSPYYEGNP